MTLLRSSRVISRSDPMRSLSSTEMSSRYNEKSRPIADCAEALEDHPDVAISKALPSHQAHALICVSPS